MTNDRIVAYINLTMTHEWMTMAPANAVQRRAAQEAGRLLTELLLIPEANPFDGLQLSADHEYNLRLNTEELHVELSCERHHAAKPALNERHRAALTPNTTGFIASLRHGEIEP